jgi:GT2 family glycosyltransferase
VTAGAPTNTDRLGVVILSYGHEQEFAPLVSDLLSRHRLTPEQITVVHNPFSAQDAWTPAVPEGVRLIRLEENLGYAGGMNAAIAQPGDVDWLLLLTHDARLGES